MDSENAREVQSACGRQGRASGLPAATHVDDGADQGDTSRLMSTKTSSVTGQV